MLVVGYIMVLRWLMVLITLREYARRLGKNPEVVYQKAARGGFQTAVKMGRDWFIDSEEPYTDNRIKSGKYVKRIK